MSVILHMIKEVPNFKAFIKPYMMKGGDCLVGHTKAQQFRIYMRDDGIPAMQFKLLCTSPNWARRMVYSYGVKTMMGNVCFRMGIQSLANPTPCGMGRKSSKVYPDSLNIGKSCVRRMMVSRPCRSNFCAHLPIGPTGWCTHMASRQ